MSAGLREVKIFSGSADPQFAEKHLYESRRAAFGVEALPFLRRGDRRLYRGKRARCGRIRRTADLRAGQRAPFRTSDNRRRAQEGVGLPREPRHAYFGYARQDRKTRSREPITAKLVANLLEKAGADRVISADLHAGQIQGFFDIPVDHLTGIPLLASYFRRTLSAEMEQGLVTVVSPDIGGVVRARKFAGR